MSGKIKINIRIAAAVVTAAVLFVFAGPFITVSYGAEYSLMDPFDLIVYTGKPDGTVARAYSSNYDNNIYVSMTDLSFAMDGTSKQFSFRYGKTEQDGEFFAVQPGESGAETQQYMTDGKIARAEHDEPVWLEFKRNRLFFNGTDRKYYTYRDGGNDLYMSLTDIQLMLDVTAVMQSENCAVIYPDTLFSPDIEALETAGYFNYVNGLVLGDATTGEILFFKDKNKVTSIASTSKLMTYLLLAEAADYGKISFDDFVVISENAEKLSKSADAAIEMKAGETVPFRELLDGMLVASSNECALALAEHSYGSEADFVSAMNIRARQLGLNSAEFFNPHGLPQYVFGSVQTKIQNRMNAEDLFKLSAYVLNTHPEITEITSKQYAVLSTLEYSSANSNPLVFNMPGVTGLKTGSTNRAGYCLVASMPVGQHNVVLVLLGSETGSERGQQAEILLRYAKRIIETEE